MRILNIPSLLLIFLAGTVYLLASFQVVAAEQQEDDASITIIEPSKKAGNPSSATIDAADIELGLFYGSLSVEDFATNSVKGLYVSYHITSKIFAQASYGVSDVGRATFEDVVGGDFLRNKDEKFKYIQLQAGYQIFHGRSFLGASHRFNSYLYVMGGIENVQFARNDEVGFTIGTRYKLVLADWLTWNIDLQDHIFERDFISDKKFTNNIQLSIGFSALF